MALLNEPWPLHDVRDAKAFVGDIVRRANLELSFHEHEELVVYLIEECWLLSERFDKERFRNSFSTWAGITLRKRTVEWDQASAGQGSSGNSRIAFTSDPFQSSSASTSTIPSAIDWTRLSPRGRAILRQIALPISNGYSKTEIAKRLGTSPHWISKSLDDLRRELEQG